MSVLKHAGLILHTSLMLLRIFSSWGCGDLSFKALDSEGFKPEALKTEDILRGGRVMSIIGRRRVGRGKTILKFCWLTRLYGHQVQVEHHQRIIALWDGTRSRDIGMGSRALLLQVYFGSLQCFRVKHCEGSIQKCIMYTRVVRQ